MLLPPPSVYGPKMSSGVFVEKMLSLIIVVPVTIPPKSLLVQMPPPARSAELPVKVQ